MYPQPGDSLCDEPEVGGGGEEASLPVSLSWALPAPPPPPRWRAWLECKGGGVCAGSYRPRPFDEFDEFEDGLTKGAFTNYVST